MPNKSITPSSTSFADILATGAPLDGVDAHESSHDQEHWWRSLSRTSLVGMALLGEDGRLRAVNDRFCTLAGRRRQELLGLNWSDLAMFMDGSGLIELGQAAGPTRAYGPWDTCFCQPDGSTIEVRVELNPAPQVFGQAAQYQVVVKDLSVQEQTRQCLEASEERYRRLFDEMEEGYALHEIICDENGKPFDFRILEVNRAFKEVTELSSDQIAGGTARTFLDSPEPWIEAYGRVALTGKPFRADYYSKRADKHFQLFASCPKRGFFSVLFLDVTTLKQEEARADLLKEALEQSPVSIIITDASGNTEYVNPTFRDLTGYSAEEALGRVPKYLTAGLQGDASYQDLMRTLEEGKSKCFEFCNRKKNGELYWEQVRISPIVREGRTTHILARAEDITERRALEAAQARLVHAVDQAVELIIITDSFGQLVYVNRAFVRHFGGAASSWMGRRAAGLLPKEGRPALACAILDSLRAGRPWQGKVRILGADGSPCTLSGTISTLQPCEDISFYTCVFRDVTTEHEVERRMQQTEKMGALGALACGVAQDFNNVLATIMTSTELIDWKVPDDSPLKPKLGVILRAALRAKDLTRRILTFGMPAGDEPILFDLSAIVRECAQLLRSALPGGVQLKEEVSPSVWALGNPPQIHQVVMNLAINGLHALGGRGRLELSLAEVEVPAAIKGFSAERKILLTVRDSGCGMDTQTVDRVFEPFFSTQAPEDGTGLGLAIVHDLVTKHGGNISISSEVGKGTLVSVSLPSAELKSASLSEAPRDEFKGTEHILLVDQEDILVALSKEALQDLGYTVTSGVDPREAFDAFKEHPAVFDVVLLQHSSGIPSPEEFATRVRKLRPGIPIILASGAQMAPGQDSLFDLALPKPFSIRDLGQALRKVLDTPEQAPLNEARPAPPHGTAQAGDILLVEDSPETLHLLHAWLLEAGHSVKVARDGQEAWEIYRGQDPASFAMVLSDVVMPRLDGLQLVERIREVDPEIPVLLFSASENPKVMKAALHLQVNEFMSKPFDSAALTACVQRLGEVVRTRQRSATTAQAVRLAQRTMEATPEEDLPIYSICEPLLDAGGDVFRCLRRPDGTLVLVVADVAGHSVVSSYALASFLGMLSTFVHDWKGLKDLFHRLNRSIQSGPFPEIPIAMGAIHWNPRTGRYHIATAGIPYGLRHRKSEGRTVFQTLKGTPLGLLEEPRLGEKVAMMEEGDRLFYGTDGLFDLPSPEGTYFRDRAASLWESLASLPLNQAMGLMCEAAKEHGNGTILDDILVVGLEQPPYQPEGHELLKVFPSVLGSVEQADRALETLLAGHPRWRDLAPDRRFQLFLALHEAMANAIEHGNGGDPLRPVGLACRLTEEAAIVRVVDGGLGFDLENYSPQETTGSGRGRGIPILRTVTNDLCMHHGELEFRFNLEGASHDTQS